MPNLDKTGILAGRVTSRQAGNKVDNSNQTGKTNYFDVIEHPLIWQWIQETAKRDPDSFGVLVDNNYRQFRLIFGKPQWQSTVKVPEKSGKRRGRVYRWYCLGEGMQWLVETGTEGTILRIKSDDTLAKFKQNPLIGLGGVAYLKRLLNIITGIESYNQ